MVYYGNIDSFCCFESSCIFECLDCGKRHTEKVKECSRCNNNKIKNLSVPRN